MNKPVETELTQRLTQQFSPQVLQVENESHRHSVPPGSETHFKVVLVCDQFEGLRQVQRHQKIYQALASLMPSPVHALALHTFAPSEWKEQPEVPASPNCMGGSKHDKRDHA
ncbi:MAG: BolA family transcriptional regulator [Hahellaceae bacterium]|nr:BolA family transcriptional regulator [Hahellaceae bacterium]